MEQKRFVKNDSGFVCSHCGKKVEPLGYTSRNHCPFCLWSRHVDIFPGDREKQLNYSLAAASLKNTIPGDFNLSTEEEILATMEHRFNAHTLYKTIE